MGKRYLGQIVSRTDSHATSSGLRVRHAVKPRAVVGVAAAAGRCAAGDLGANHRYEQPNLVRASKPATPFAAVASREMRFALMVRGGERSKAVSP